MVWYFGFAVIFILILGTAIASLILNSDDDDDFSDGYNTFDDDYGW